MAEKRNPRDEKLIKELYDKLNWFTFKATDEEFDPDQVQTILDLLDKLDPLPERTEPDRETLRKRLGEKDSAPENEGESKAVPMSNAEAAFERFKKKYNITEEDLARKNSGSAAETNAEGETTAPFRGEFAGELAYDSVQAREIAGGAGRGAEVRVGAVLEAGSVTKQSDVAQVENVSNPPRAKKTWFGRFFATGWGKVAVAFVVVLVVFTVTTIGTSAVKQKSFFEVVKSGFNRMRITVTGNEMENEPVSIAQDDNDKVYYDSWDEVLEENSELLTPGYIPEGLSLEELYRRDAGNYILYQSSYFDKNSNELLISIEEYSKEYAKLEKILNDKWEFVDENENVKYYRFQERYKAFWEEDSCIYTVEWISLDEINNIIGNMR